MCAVYIDEYMLIGEKTERDRYGKYWVGQNFGSWTQNLRPFDLLTDCRHRSPLLLSSAFSAISLGFNIFGEIFGYVTPFFFFNPTKEIVTFCLRGWNKGNFQLAVGRHSAWDKFTV